MTPVRARQSWSACPTCAAAAWSSRSRSPATTPYPTDGRTLTFTRDADGQIRDESGSAWSVFGTAVSGTLAGAQLEAVEHLDTFWFAWVAFQPETTIIGADSGG